MTHSRFRGGASFLIGLLLVVVVFFIDANAGAFVTGVLLIVLTGVAVVEIGGM